MSIPADKNYIQIHKGDCNVYVETGCYRGESILLAEKAGFEEIYSIDIDFSNLPDSPEEFMAKNFGGLELILGDSPEALAKLLPRLKGKKPMIFLDAHSQMFEGEEDDYPLLRELQAIKESGIIDATILIDDFLYMSHRDITGWTKLLIEQYVTVINPSYEITYLPNPIKNNILLAKI